MLAAYEFLDSIVHDSVDLFSDQGLEALLQLNHLVLLGEDYDSRAFSRHIFMPLHTSIHRRKSSLRTSVRFGVSFACLSTGAGSGTFFSKTLAQSLSAVRRWSPPTLLGCGCNAAGDEITVSAVLPLPEYAASR
jgi:hypothetical protein